MAFRNALSAAAIAALLTGQKIIGSTIETAADGTPRIIMGPPAYNGTSPAICWDPTGAGVSWADPAIYMAPDGHLEMDGPFNGTSGASLTLWPRSGGGAYVQLAAMPSLTGWLFIDGDSGITSIGGPVTAAGPVTATGEAWNAPVLTNAWVNYGAPHRPAGYRKMADGTVMLRGLVKAGAGGIFTLPAGYRPGFEEVFTCAASASTNARVDVQTNGVVTVLSYDTGGTNAFVSLAGIRFSCID